MVSDREPRYRLVDSNGDVVGSLHAETDGTLRLQEGTSGNDNEASLQTDGTWDVPAVSTEQATIDGKEGMAMPATSTSGDLSFDDWEQASADRPATVVIRAEVVTDGSDFGIMSIEVDESGGTTSDYVYRLAEISPDAGSNSQIAVTTTVPLPVGAQYRVRNNVDPTGNNSFEVERVFVQ